MAVFETLSRVFQLLAWLSTGGRSIDSGWWIVLVFAVQFMILGLIFRTWVGPFILRSISRRIRVRSISLRSVRGVFVRTSSMTIRIDRVGLSYHPSANATRRFSFKVEGLHVKIHELKVPLAHQSTASSKRFSRLPHLSDFSPSPIARRLWSMYSALYAFIEPSARPVIRTFFVTSARIIIRCLPTLTQVIDFELNHALFTLATLSEAHVTVGQITLSTTVEFSNLENVIGSEESVTRDVRWNQNFLSMTHLQARFTGSARRVWERAWGRTRGRASFILNIQKISVFADAHKWTPAEHLGSSEADASHFATSRFDFVTHPSHSGASCFSLLGLTEFMACFEFGPRKGIIAERSLSTSLKIPTVHISVGPLVSFLIAVKDLRKERNLRSPNIATGISLKKLQSVPSNFYNHRRTPLSKLSLFRIADFSIKEIIVQFGSGTTGTSSSRAFTGRMRNLVISLHIGDPGKDGPHVDFLGNHAKKDSELDADVLSLSLSMKEVTVHRRDLEEKSPFSQVIIVGPVILRGFATQWLPFMLPYARVFHGDPNASLLVIKLDISSPQLSERVDVIGDILGEFQQTKVEKPISKASRHIQQFIPRMQVDIAVRDVAACIIPVERDGIPASSIILSSTQSYMSFSTFFKDPVTKPDLTGFEQDIYTPLEMEISIQSILGPAFVTVLSRPLVLGPSSPKEPQKRYSSHFGDPFLSLSAIDLMVSGQVLGGILDDSNKVILDIESMMLELKCITDAVSVELWQPSALLSLKSLLESTRSVASETATRRDTRNNLLDRLPSGVSAHIAIGQIGLIVTGKDLNPNEDLDLSRGIAINTGLVLQYCSLHNHSHFSRLPGRFTQAHNRQKLHLTEELLMDAISISGASQQAGNKFALFRCTALSTVLRASVATEFAADHAYEAEEENEVLRSTEFLWIKALEMDALVSSQTQRPDDSHENGKERLQLSFKAPYIQSQLQLFHVYCMLLALSTLRSFFGTHRDTEVEVEYRKSPIGLITSCQASINTVQILFKLPLQEHICLRIDGLSLRKSNRGVFGVNWGTLLIFVPSPQQVGMWEELLRFQSWKITRTGSETEPLTFAIDGESARLRIPCGYIVSDLILNFNVLFKCLRHLGTIVSSTEFKQMPVPAAEEAKVVPVINMRIGCLSVEAADDPLESKLGLTWRAGFDASRARLERDEAFEAKVAAIKAAELKQMDILNAGQRFTPQHSVSIEEANVRLLQVHAISWMSLHREFREEQKRKEDAIQRRIRGDSAGFSGVGIDILVPLVPSLKSPPVIRIILTSVALSIKQPLFDACNLHDFLHDLGNGLPRNTGFTLLVPLHLNLALGSSCVTLRDYPLPLLNIPQESSEKAVAWSIDTNLVIAEEIGTSSSMIWKECPITLAESFSANAKPMILAVPKTTMPVKIYANPTINVLTSRLTEFCWGFSYNAALQDVMRIIDTLSTPPPDPSPSVGFWDKVRLILHCRVEVTFEGEVHLNLKGSRDPYATDGNGAGFAFCWSGNTKMSIGQQNPENEFLQVISDTMLIVIPKFEKQEFSKDADDDALSHSRRNSLSINSGLRGRQKDFKKICAKFTSGIRWGIGIVLERTCGASCSSCGGSFACRLFNFRPHYEIMLEPKSINPQEKTSEDSFNEFRSDYIHFSTSLTSSVRHRISSSNLSPNSLHLTPKTFAHFWSWWELFDRSLSIPIRQGILFTNARPSSKKFGQHLATLKYRLDIAQLFISHVYMDDSKEAWADGITDFIGMKALVTLFEADLHQREQEALVPAEASNTTKRVRHKPFYAAEVKLVGLQLRAILATFIDPLKRLIDLDDPQKESRFKDVKADVTSELSQYWVDMDDFVETDWKRTESKPTLHMLPVGACPRFTYLKRSSVHQHHTPFGSDSQQRASESSRFGNEDTHMCMMGKEPSVHQLQSEIVATRISILKQQLLSIQNSQTRNGPPNDPHEMHTIQKNIQQLERHVVQLRETDVEASSDHDHSDSDNYANYLMPSDISCPADWTEFDNVYQIHCPKFSLNDSTREILTQYYYCSVARRGFEYHMATRAVMFIREQANAYAKESGNTDEKDRKQKSHSSAAAQAFKKILIGNDDDNIVKLRSSDATNPGDEVFNPMDGWSEGVSLNKSHFCLLLKPQILLNDSTKDSILVLAAVQATLQSFAILDTANIEDPISGRVMTRSHAVLSGLQTFSPSSTCPARHDGVPLEVLIDLRAESDHFDRLVPQTRATFRYDKFNRLRLRNKVTSVVANSADQMNGHLQNQTDLINISVPRFTVSASSKNFEAIASIITNVLLQSDSAHKMHLGKVETLLFSYDFTDLSSAADVVEGLQLRLRRTVEREKSLENAIEDGDEQGQLELMKSRAHIFLLSEELNLIFDAIKLSQDKADDKHGDSKSALKVRAWSREISWGMVDDCRDLIAKLAVRGIDFTWLSRQDGSTVNKLSIGDLQAFDGSLDAEWPEILAKHREPSNHSLVKRGIFVKADWIVLAPVGGITIYEQFILELHPMRLQLEARVGRSIMEYVWPARRDRKRLAINVDSHASDMIGEKANTNNLLHDSVAMDQEPVMLSRVSVEAPSKSYQRKRYSTEERRPSLNPTPKRITNSRSFTDLRHASRQNSRNNAPMSSDFLLSDGATSRNNSLVSDQGKFNGSIPMDSSTQKNLSDAAEMKSRSAQKHFVLVRISSMHILLSFHKDGSFFCRDARIQSRELQYRNQTWSFEELAEQFIPSDTSWRGWMRVALHQPLVPVFPVARELLSKTKWIAAKGRVARQARRFTPTNKAAQSDLTSTARSSEQSGTSEFRLLESAEARRSQQAKRYDSD